MLSLLATYTKHPHTTTVRRIKKTDSTIAGRAGRALLTSADPALRWHSDALTERPFSKVTHKLGRPGIAVEVSRLLETCQVFTGWLPAKLCIFLGIQVATLS